MRNDDMNVWTGGTCVILIALITLGLALFPTHCANAATRYLQPGQCVTVKRDRYCAPAKTACPTPAPCPTQKPCPQPTPCPAYTSDMYWYAISSLFLSCGSEGTGWNLSASDYVKKLSNLSLAKPEIEMTVSGCYVRVWSNAVVILNPQTVASCTIPLEGSYKDLETGLSVSGSVIVEGRNGRVLIK